MPIAQTFETACLAELQAIKPGNVHVFADGHGMVVEDFVKSAAAAASVIAMPGFSVGERIREAVSATWQAVNCNTNLGIILLCAPMIHAVIHKTSLPKVLAGLTVADAIDAYQAIVQASPAGLGRSERHDVRDKPSVTLLQAMQQAENQDRIAWQYTHDFEDIFRFGLRRYAACLNQWDNETWATTATYLGFMAEFPDSHIVRKHGMVVAMELQQQARQHEMNMLAYENPKKYLGELLRFDRQLKQNGLNPGTSADMTVATLLANAFGADLGLGDRV